MEHNAQTSRRYKENWEDAVQASKADAAEIAELKEAYALLFRDNALLRQVHADFRRECGDTDAILRVLGLDPVNCRTDGGSLKLAMISGALEHTGRRDRGGADAGAQDQATEGVSMKRYEHYGALNGGGPAEPIEESDGEWVRYEDAMNAIAAERERCAKVCEAQEYEYWRASEDQDFTPQDCADAIRRV